MAEKRENTSRSLAKPPASLPPRETLLKLTAEAMMAAGTAKKHGQSLSGNNFYADKMATLRADATIAFRKLAPRAAGNSPGLADLLRIIFSANSSTRERQNAVRELQFDLKTAFAETSADQSHLEAAGIFPLAILQETRRGYLTAIGRQMNGAYASEWYDASAVMMRRLLESSIIEAFEAKKVDHKIKDPTTGDFLQLTGLINAALAEGVWNLPRNVRKDLQSLRDVGHRSAHNRYYLARKPDIDKVAGVYREAVEAFLHVADLLKCD